MGRQFKSADARAEQPGRRPGARRSHSPAHGRARWREQTPRPLLLRRATAFTASAGLVAYLALDGGGYDIAVRQGVALGVWSAIAIGYALGVLPRGRPPRALLVPAVAGAGLVIWTILSFTWTESDERTMAELARLVGYLGLAVLAISSLNRYTFRAAAAGISVAAFAIAAVAVASRLAPEMFPGATEVAAQFRSDRLDFPLDYWNATGAWGAMACAIGLAWSAHARLRVFRAISLAAVPVAGLAVYLSYSRGGVVGALAAVLAVLVLSRNRWTTCFHAVAGGAGTAIAVAVVRSNPEIANATGGAGGGEVALALAAAAALGAGAVLVTSLARSDRLRLAPEVAKWAVPAFVGVLLAATVAVGGGQLSDWWDEFRKDDTPAAGPDPATRLTSAGGNRNQIWTSAIDASEEHPLKGLGAGTFEFWWLREGDDDEYVRDAHSLYLEQAAELGYPGLLLLLGSLGGILAAALVARRRTTTPGDIGASVAMCSAFCVFLVNAGVDWMWEETAVAAVGIGGVAVAAAAGTSRRSRRARRSALVGPGGRACIVLGAVIAAAIQIPGIVSTQRVRASEQALAAGDLGLARTLAEQGVEAQPWAAGPHAQLAIVEREAGELASAQEEIETAIAREPSNWEWPLVLAPIQADRGDRRAAIETFENGRRLAPRLPFYSPFSFGYGRQVYTVGQLERIVARAQAEEAQ